MPTTTSGFYYADASTAMSAEDISAAEATAAQNVIDGLITDNRQQQSYIWADSSARTAQTGMAAGDKGYQVDTAFDYYYTGSAWMPESGFMEFTPTWTNLTVGNGTNSWFIQVSKGFVMVQGSFTMGSTSAMGTNPYFATPPIAGLFVDAELLGGALMKDGTVRYHGEVHYDTAIGAPLPRRFLVSGTNILDAGITATSPFTWGTGDILALNYRYRAA